MNLQDIEIEDVRIYEVAYLNGMYEELKDHERRLTDKANKEKAKALVLLNESDEGISYILISQDQSVDSLLRAMAAACEGLSGFSLGVWGSDEFKEAVDIEIEKARGTLQ